MFLNGKWIIASGTSDDMFEASAERRWVPLEAVESHTTRKYSLLMLIGKKKPLNKPTKRLRKRNKNIKKSQKYSSGWA
jgi:hypothetical protein